MPYTAATTAAHLQPALDHDHVSPASLDPITAAPPSTVPDPSNRPLSPSLPISLTRLSAHDQTQRNSRSASSPSSSPSSTPFQLAKVMNAFSVSSRLSSSKHSLSVARTRRGEPSAGSAPGHVESSPSYHASLRSRSDQHRQQPAAAVSSQAPSPLTPVLQLDFSAGTDESLSSELGSLFADLDTASPGSSPRNAASVVQVPPLSENVLSSERHTLDNSSLSTLRSKSSIRVDTASTTAQHYPHQHQALQPASPVYAYTSVASPPSPPAATPTLPLTSSAAAVAWASLRSAASLKSTPAPLSPKTPPSTILHPQYKPSPLASSSPSLTTATLQHLPISESLFDSLSFSSSSFTAATTNTPSMNTSQSITAYPSPPLKASIPPASPTLTESLAVSKHFSGSQLTFAAYIPPPAPEQLTMPEVSYSTTYTTALGNDEESAPSSESSSSSSSPAPSSASSSVSEHSNSNQRYQLHDNPVPGPKAAVATLRATQSHEVLSIIPPKSEDWAALIGEPQSPVEFQYQTHSMPYDGAAYTASPAAENGTEASTDYMQAYQPQQHQPRQASDDQYQMHTSTDPSGMQWYAYPYQYQLHNSPYGHYQNHGSTPSVPLADAATVRNDSYRRSLSTSEILRGSSPNLSTYPHGYLTPPRSGDDTMPRSRPSSGAKQFSVATSISLADASILAKYRESAIKTNDPSTQLSFAKYLLDISEHYPSEPYSSLSSVSTSSVTEIQGQQHPHRTLSESSDSASPTLDQQPSPSPPNSATIQQSPNGSRRQFIEEAKFLIDRLAKEGQPEAQFIRGSWYEEGLYDTKKNVDKALRWYLSASKGDFGPAHYKVAYFWEKKRDNNKAVMMYKKAAIHNNALANHRLAMVYFFGELNQSKNLKTGLEYLKRAAALATETAPMSPYVLGLILSREYKPINIPDDIAFPDDGEALEWFRKSAQLGHGPANYKLGTCYEYGNLGCSVDPFLSIRHYELAVLAGDSNGEAEMALSGWYLSGSGNYFAADDHLAFQYASLAAEKQLPKAQYAMGYYYEMGISVEIDMDKAMEFYKMAAANGSKDAMKRLEEPSSAPSHTRLRSSIKRGKKNRSRNAKEQSCSIM